MSHGRRRAVTLIAGGTLLSAATGGIVAAVTSGGAAAATAPGLSESCQPLTTTSASPSPSATKASATPTPSTSPTTAAPTTAAPTTQAPTTPPPSSQAPTTPPPSSQAPTSPPPSSQAPTTPPPSETPTGTPTTSTPTGSPTAAAADGAVDGVSGRPIVLAAFQAPAATTIPTSLCVGVVPLQQSSDRGQAATWEVGAWTEGGNVPDAKLQLAATAGTGVPTFTFGCAKGNGTSACDLGAVDAGSAQRLFQAQVSVPLTATGLSAVSLAVTGSAANISLDPTASASVVVLAAGSPAGASLPPSTINPSGFAFPSPTASAGGNAADLFPTVAPGSSVKDSPVANVSALKGGTPIGSEVAEGAGLAALGVAMLLAITRVSLRRPTPRHAANSAAAAAPPPDKTASGTADETDSSV